MTDYDELSYLRKLANKQRAQVKILEAFKSESTDLYISLISKETPATEIEDKLYKLINKTENTLKLLNNA